MRMRLKIGEHLEIVAKDEEQVVRLNDAEGRLLIEYDTQTARLKLYVPEGNLEICAPQGEVGIHAHGLLRLQSDTSIAIEAPVVRLSGEAGEVHMRTLDVLAFRVRSRVQNAYHEIEGLMQTRAKRLRTWIKESLYLRGEHLNLRAEEDLKLDGKQVHLG